MDPAAWVMWAIAIAIVAAIAINVSRKKRNAPSDNRENDEG